VADDLGRTVTLIGPSGSGKTTAIALLATRLGYLSDETTSVDDDLRVHPHAKPLSVITDPAAPHLKQSVSPDELALLRPPDDCRLHRMVLLRRGDDDHGLRPVRHAHAIPQIVEQTSSLVRLEQPILRLTQTIDACGGVWALHYREFGDWVDDLVALFDREPQPAPPRVHHPGRDADDAVPGAWRRTEWLDAVEYDEELVVMVGAQVHVLAGLGVVVWLALASPRTADELVAEVTALWGEHPDARRLVEEALDVLAEQDLVHPPD
jgi:energy-coupling factor transporter ATP-binding protein EcfA2